MIEQIISRCGAIYPGTRNKLAILIYHRVLPGHDWLQPEELTEQTFRWHMALIAKHFNPLPLAEALAHLEKGTLPDRAICVTFDDGYVDNLSVALPIAQAFGVPMTVFVATDFLDGGSMWNDCIRESVRVMDCTELDLTEVGLPRFLCHDRQQKRQVVADLIQQVKYLEPSQRLEVVEAIKSRVVDSVDSLMLTRQQVVELADNGVNIGAHTQSHPILSNLEPEEAREEIEGSKRFLEQLTGISVDHFAYPNGRRGVDYQASHRNFVESAGFKAAVSTDCGVSTSDSDRYQLPRFTPWDGDRRRFLARLLMNYARRK